MLLFFCLLGFSGVLLLLLLFFFLLFWCPFSILPICLGAPLRFFNEICLPIKKNDGVF
jgi:hypothetical protein